jgi:formylglycine-generating enzyme required for sulfatase activity
MAMAKLFICYRREDSAWPAQRIYEELRNHFGAESVVIDIDSIPIGRDFREYIDEKLSVCDVLLTVIGDRWLDILEQRLDNPKHFVRLEVQAALQRNIPVIPVLVDKASVPDEGTLPPGLTRLAYQQAAEVRAGPDLPIHLKRLTGGLDQLLSPKPGTVFRDKLKDGSPGPEMVVIPDGEFQMGEIPRDGSSPSPSATPVHLVRIPKMFAIGRYPVIFEQYDRFAESTGAKLPWDGNSRDSQYPGRKNRPVFNVSWENAVAYVSWLSDQTGKDYRLPSEAEWEYAARAGTDTRWSFGDDEAKLEEYAWVYRGLSRWGAPEVGEKKPNGWGLYDVHGNVREWVQDCWHDTYKGAPPGGGAWLRAGNGDCTRRVIRGGSWGTISSASWSCSRDSGEPGKEIEDLGFRVARRIVEG